MPRKILIVTTVSSTLGLYKGQFEYLHEKGFQIEIISSAGTDLRRLGQIPHFIVHEVRMHRSMSPVSDLFALVRITRLLRRIKPDIIHSSTPKAGLLSMLAAEVARIPIKMFTMHGVMSELGKGLERYLLTALEFLICQCADVVLAVSESVQSAAVRNRVCPQAKIIVLSKGSCNGVDAINQFNRANIDISEVVSLRAKLRLPPDAIIVGFVGRLVSDKGIRELKDAWSLVEKMHANARLLIIGPTERRDAVPKSILQFLYGCKSARIIGEIESSNIQYYYAVMDIFVLPTYREGLPTVVLEASAMELPVVATKVTGCVDAVVDGVTGMLVPARDHSALANAIMKYLDSLALRKKHGRTGRDRVLSDFKPDSIWNELCQEYDRQLHKKDSI